MTGPRAATIAREQITGLVLAGGRGERMGGIEKGLLPLDGVPLARRALERLAPQVGRCALNANRRITDYAAWGVPVWPDTLPGQHGPMAGILAGLVHAETDWLVTVPCDVPAFPLDLVDRLAAALHASGGSIAVAVTPAAGGGVEMQPVFALMSRALLAEAQAFLDAGRRSVGRWIDGLGAVTVCFDEAGAFDNLNTPEELRAAARP